MLPTPPPPQLLLGARERRGPRVVPRGGAALHLLLLPRSLAGRMQRKVRKHLHVICAWLAHGLGSCRVLRRAECAGQTGVHVPPWTKGCFSVLFTPACCAVLCCAGDAAAEGTTCEVATSTFIPLIEGAVAEYIAKWQERPAPRGTAQQVSHLGRMAAANHNVQPTIMCSSNNNIHHTHIHPGSVCQM